IIERRSCVRCCSLRKILEIVMTHDPPGMFGADSHPAHHPRVAIGVAEINISVDENVPIIRTPRCQNECAQDRDLENGEENADQLLHKTNNRKSKIENRK